MKQREIKFRGLTASGEWVDGYYVMLAGRAYIIPEEQQFRDIYDADIEDSFVGVDQETLGQYANINDIDDNELFEGDIMGDEEPRYIVVFRDGAFRLKLLDVEPTEWSPNADIWGTLHRMRELATSGRKDDKMFIKLFRRIGNVYENPDLLE